MYAECFDSFVPFPSTGVRRLFAKLGRMRQRAAVWLGMRQARQEVEEPTQGQKMVEERGPRSHTKTGKGRYMLLWALVLFRGKHTSPLAWSLPLAFFPHSPPAMGSGAECRLNFVLTRPVGSSPFGFLNANVCISPTFSTVAESEPSAYGLEGATHDEYGVAGAARPRAPYLFSTIRQKENIDRGEYDGKGINLVCALYVWSCRACGAPSAVYLLLVVRFSCLVFFNDNR